MSAQLIGLGLIVFALMFDHVQLRNKVESLSLRMMNKVDKPPAETALEQYKRERNERVERLEKEDSTASQ